MVCGFSPFTVAITRDQIGFQIQTHLLLLTRQITTQIQKAALPCSSGVGRWGPLPELWVLSEFHLPAQLPYQGTRICGGGNAGFTQPPLEALAYFRAARSECQHSFSSPGTFSLLCLFYKPFYVLRTSACTLSSVCG